MLRLLMFKVEQEKEKEFRFLLDYAMHSPVPETDVSINILGSY